MNATIIIMTAVLLQTLFSSLGVYYGVNIAKAKNDPSHGNIQNIIFIVCMFEERMSA